MATRKPKAADDSQAHLLAARALVDLPAQAVTAGNLVETDAETMAALIAAGTVDPHPDAVAYARSL